MGKVGFVALAAIGGVIAGLLLAPKSGKETRKDLADKAQDLKGRASDGLSEFKKGADTVKEEIVSGAEVVGGEVSRRAAAVKNEAVHTTKNVQHQVTRQ